MADIMLGGIKFSESMFQPKVDELKYNTLYKTFCGIVMDWIKKNRALVSEKKPIGFKVSDFYKVKFKVGKTDYKYVPSTVKRCIEDFNREYTGKIQIESRVDGFKGRGKKIVFTKKFVDEFTKEASENQE
jgi:hypothetical protein